MQVNYEANGWVTHHVSDIWAKTSPYKEDPVWAIWPMGGAWLCTHLWEHYTYTMDRVSSGFFINYLTSNKSCITKGESNKYRFP
jgi:hypothetical protein